MSRRAPAIVLGLALVALAACGGGPSTRAGGRPSTATDVVLSVRTVAGLGPIIVTHGWTLYMYPPDR